MSTLTQANATQSIQQIKVYPDSSFKPMADWFQEASRKHIEDMMIEIEAGNGVLLKSTGDIFIKFLLAIDADVRQEYNCRSCKTYLNGVGSIVFVKEGTYEVIPFGLPPADENIPAEWAYAYSEARDALLASNSFTVLQKDEAAVGNWFGTPCSTHQDGRNFTHFYAGVEDEALRGWLIDVLPKYDKHGVGKSEVTASLEWFETILKTDWSSIRETDVKTNDWSTLSIFQSIKDALSNRNVDRGIYARYWLAKTGLLVLQLKNSSIGTVIQNIADGNGTEVALAKYKQMTDPRYYKRAIRLPNEQEFEAGVKYLEEKGYDKYLPLRMMSFDELVPYFVWVKPVTAAVGETKKASLFDNLRDKVVKNESEKVNKELFANAIGISLAGFIDTILNGPDKIHGVKYLNDVAFIGGFSTPVDEGASAIFNDNTLPINWNFTQYMSRIGKLGSGTVAHWNNVDLDKSCDGLRVCVPRNGRDRVLALVYDNTTWLEKLQTPCFADNYISELHVVRRLLEHWGRTTPMNIDENGDLIKYDNSLITVAVTTGACLEVEFDKSIRRFEITAMV